MYMKKWCKNDGIITYVGVLLAKQSVMAIKTLFNIKLSKKIKWSSL